MLHTLSLILPVLIPSWRFFKSIEPSPRVQWALCPIDADIVEDWHEFRPRPMNVTPLQMLGRLFWNPARNDALFLVSLAERIAQSPTAHSIDEINRRLRKDMAVMGIGTAHKMMRFRLVFISRGETGLSEEVLFVSDPAPIDMEGPDDL